MKKHERLAKKREKRMEREARKFDRKLRQWGLYKIFPPPLLGTFGGVNIFESPILDNILHLQSRQRIVIGTPELGECVLGRQGTHSKPQP
jgi:hypothetical protein